ncbi:sensor histidine kinase [Anoxynatronum sibiricum]|uniref:histidine kinase n=1 Tax=Anoxynatronum sibiricum TaxID=210623 RepID=A0ABU9VSD9_9CLOT
MKLKRRVSLLLTLAFSLLLLISIIRINQHSSLLKATAGKLHVDFGQFAKGTHQLAGEWLMYDGLYTPDELAALDYTVTGDMRYNSSMAGNTYAFYMQVDDPESLHFIISSTYNFHLWINHQPVLSEDGSNRLKTHDAFSLEDYAGNTPGYSFVLQVYSPSDLRGSYFSLLLGTKDQIRFVHDRWIVLESFALGIYAMIILNSFVLYALKRSEHYLLLLPLSSLLAFWGSLTVLQYPVFHQLIPQGVFMYIFFTLLMHPSILNFELTRQLIPDALPPKTQWFFYALYAVSLSVFFFVGNIPVILQNYASVLNWFLILVQGWMILHSYRRNRPEAPILFLGLCILIVSRLFFFGIQEGLIPHGMVDIELQPRRYAYIIYIVCFSIAINGIFARKFSKADSLAIQLEKTNQNLKRIVDEKTADLTKSYNQIVNLQDAKKVFLSEVAHNLRSPLFALIGYVDMLQADLADPSPKTEQYLRQINERIDYIQKMAEELFLVARLEEDQVPFNMIFFDLSLLLQRVLENHAGPAKQRQIALSVESLPEKTRCYGDQFRLQQAIENIVSNALQHTDEGGRVTISLFQRDNGTLHLKICDTGSGITPEALPHIFNRYYSHTSSTTAKKSTGLGLTIAQKIIQMHQGTIEVKSTVGEGSEFIIILPDVK